MKRKARRHVPVAGLVGALLILALAGCAASCPAGLSPQQDVTLFFGGSVPDAAWADFAATTLTPAFPDGLTVVAASGQWRDPRTGTVVAEASRVVSVFGQPSRATIDAVRDAYRARFAQQSVGLSIRRACAAF